MSAKLPEAADRAGLGPALRITPFQESEQWEEVLIGPCLSEMFSFHIAVLSIVFIKNILTFVDIMQASSLLIR